MLFSNKNAKKEKSSKRKFSKMHLSCRWPHSPWPFFQLLFPLFRFNLGGFFGLPPPSGGPPRPSHRRRFGRQYRFEDA